jgi:hypothetical protein
MVLTTWLLTKSISGSLLLYTSNTHVGLAHQPLRFLLEDLTLPNRYICSASWILKLLQWSATVKMKVCFRSVFLTFLQIPGLVISGFNAFFSKLTKPRLKFWHSYHFQCFQNMFQFRKLKYQKICQILLIPHYLIYFPSSHLLYKDTLSVFCSMFCDIKYKTRFQSFRGKTHFSQLSSTRKRCLLSNIGVTVPGIFFYHIVTCLLSK